MGKTGLPDAESWVYAHMTGDGGLVHVASAEFEEEHFLTAGADCTAQLRRPDTLLAAGDAGGVGHHDAGVTAVAAPRAAATRFATGCDDGQVRVFAYPGGALQAIAMRFSLPVRALAFSDDGATLAAGGDDDAIRLLDVSGEQAALRHTLTGAFRAVRSLAFDPKGELLASCHEDGAVLLWDAATGALAKDLGKVAPSVARADWHAYNRLAWAPDGARLAVPGRNNDVVLFGRDQEWAEAARLKGSHLGDVSLLAFSPNGLYCASAGMDLQVVLWDLRGCVAVGASKLPDAATGLAWRAKPGTNALAVLTHEGTVALWDAPVSARLPPPATPLEEVELSEFDAPTAGGGFVDDSAVDAADADDDADGGVDAGGDDDADEGDSSGGESEGRERPPRSERVVMLPAEPLPQAQPQEAVAPGATPASGAPARRFLAYNTLGCVTCRDDGAGVQHIEVHFHDVERPGPRVPSHTDYLGVQLGALGPAGVAYASPEKGETAGTLMFRPFEGWSANAEWTLPFPAGEAPLCLAVGASFCAVATSARLVRLATPMGVQTGVFATEGAPVALAAHGGVLAVAWHAALPVGPPPGEQRLAYALYDVASGAQQGGGPLPLTPGAQLTWLGFSEEGLLAAGDSAGALRLRSGEYGGGWVPVFSSAAARASDAERHWVVGLSGAEVFAVVCKAPDATPAVAPRPVLSLFPLAVPLLGAPPPPAPGAPPPANLEEALVRARLWAADAARLHGHGSQPALAAELELNKALLKLFNAALKADRLGRAAELAAHMTHASCLDGALKMANAARAVALADRITGIIHARLALEVEQGGEELAAEYPSQALGGVVPRAAEAPPAAAKFARRQHAVAPEAAVAAAARADENSSPPGRKREAPKPSEADEDVPAPPPAKKAATAPKPAGANPFVRK